MSNRKHSPTSKAAHEFIKPHKANHKQRILEGLGKLKVGGNFEEIALAAGMKDSQVWRRTSEMVLDGTIFNTGITRKLSSGVGGTVWQLTEKGWASIQQFTPTEDLQSWFTNYLTEQPESKPISIQTNLF